MNQPTSAWSRTPAARAILSRIEPSKLYVSVEQQIVGPDRLVLTFIGKEDLEKVRRAFVDRTVGMTFAQANADGRAEDYFAADDCHADVDDVLNGMFGDPNRYGRHAETAQASIRAAFIQNERAVA